MKITATILNIYNNNKAPHEWREYIKGYTNNPELIKMNYNLSESVICNDARLPVYKNNYKICNGDIYIKDGAYAKPAVEYIGKLNINDKIKLGIALYEENEKLVLQADTIGLTDYSGNQHHNIITIKKISDLYNISHKKNFSTTFNIDVINACNNIINSYIITLNIEFNIVEQITNGLKIWKNISIVDDYLSEVLADDEEISEDVLAVYSILHGNHLDNNDEWYPYSMSYLPEVCDLEHCIKLIASYAEDIVEQFKENNVEYLEELRVTI